MALAVPAILITFVTHVLAIAGFILVLVWTLHFRGGFAWEAENKNLIFNVSSLSLSLSLGFSGFWVFNVMIFFS